MIKKFGLYTIILFLGMFTGIYIFIRFYLPPEKPAVDPVKTATGQVLPTADIIPADVSFDSFDRPINQSRRNAIVQAVEIVSPSVVSLTVTQERVLRRRSIFDDFYSDFWGRYIPPRKYIQKIQSLGSGVIINPDGYILTNAHVVQGANNIRVVLPRGDEYEGTVVGLDNTTDLAVVKINGDDLPYATLGDSDDLIIGEWAIAFGNPFGYLLEDTEPTITAGVISALHRDIKRDPNQVQIFKDMIQTDAAINPGNSGGPLANAAGEVIGINTFIFSSSKGSEGIGFAIPINRARTVVKDLIEHGEVIKAWIGVYVQKITPLLAQSLDLSVSRGVIIVDIDEDSPAENAGLQRGDILIRANKERIVDDADWDEIESMSRPGEIISLSVIRGNKELELNLKPVESLSALSNARLDKFGLYVTDITSAIARQLRLESHSGVVVAKIDPDGRAASWDFEPGDIIRQIGRLTLSDTKDYFDILKKVDKGTKLTFILERKDAIFYLTVRY